MKPFAPPGARCLPRRSSGTSTSSNRRSFLAASAAAESSPVPGALSPSKDQMRKKDSKKGEVNTKDIDTFMLIFSCSNLRF